ncbi:transmembrane protein 199 [Diprion similis]|uniref:transmembrane protein 199 n=1 Tax=Diprion similis TaxID=362088 RepID=UPI001EF96C0D|nr:transmembrane protein 199 [Diprion similis]XP_046736534.1 transmembrane protein 199 [Diprion similis]
MPVGPIKNPLITIKPGAALIEFVVKKVTDVEKAPDGITTLKNSTKKQRSNVVLKLDDVRWLNNYLIEWRKTSDEKFYIHEFLETSEIILPTPEVTPRNPELEARIQKLILQQNSRDYRAMTKNIDSVRKKFPEDTIAYQMKEMNRHLIAVAQFIFSVLAGFMFGFIGIELIIGNLDFGFRLLLGIIFALIIALAEIYFLAKKLNEEDYIITMDALPTKKFHQE